MLAFTEWRELANAGKLNEAQIQFHRRRPAQQLFDVEADPHEVNNLANDPEYTKVLADLRSRMQKKLREVNDLSFYPESFMVQNALQDGVTYGTTNHKEINRLVDIADLALLPFAEAHKPLAAALKAKPPMELYWACTTASVIGEQARPLVPLVKKLLTHENLMVRMRAAEFLGSIKAADPMPTLLSVLNTARTEQELICLLYTSPSPRDS